MKLKTQDYLEVVLAMDKDHNFQAVVLAMDKTIQETIRQLELLEPQALSQVEVEAEAEQPMEDRPKQVATLDMDQPTQPQHLIVDQPSLQAKEQPNMEQEYQEHQEHQEQQGHQEQQEHQEHPSLIQDTNQANDCWW